MKNEMMITTEILNDEQLDIVTGGTFTSNKYKELIYNQAGISTTYNFFAQDKFYALNKDDENRPISYSQANWAVEYWMKHNTQPRYEVIVKGCRE